MLRPLRVSVCARCCKCTQALWRLIRPARLRLAKRCLSSRANTLAPHAAALAAASSRQATSGSQLIASAMAAFFDLFPTPSAVMQAEDATILAALQPLGLQVGWQCALVRLGIRLRAH